MKRVQRKRSAGWRMPENTKYVGRPTKWGNPWKVGGDITPKIAVENYLAWVKEQIKNGSLIMEELRGKNLACFCPLDRPCHVDVLLQLFKTTLI